MSSFLERDLIDVGFPEMIRRHAAARIEDSLQKQQNNGFSDEFPPVFDDIEAEVGRVVRSALASVFEKADDATLLTHLMNLPPKNVAYCAIYGGFGVSDSFHHYYVNRTGHAVKPRSEDYDRALMGKVMSGYGKEKAAQYPKTFRAVLAFCRTHAEVKYDNFEFPARIRNQVRDGSVKAQKSKPCFEDAITVDDNGEDTADWKAFEETRFPPSIMESIDVDHTRDREKDNNKLMEFAYEQFGLQCASCKYCALDLHIVTDPLHKYAISEYDGLEEVWCGGVTRG